MPQTPEQYQQALKAQESEFAKQAEAARMQVGYRPTQAQLLAQTPSQAVQIQNVLGQIRGQVSQAYGQAQEEYKAQVPAAVQAYQAEYDLYKYQQAKEARQAQSSYERQVKGQDKLKADIASGKITPGYDYSKVGSWTVNPATGLPNLPTSYYTTTTTEVQGPPTIPNQEALAKLGFTPVFNTAGTEITGFTELQASLQSSI